MTPNWMLGTAFAAVLVAAPAFAQSPNAQEPESCSLADLDQAGFDRLDTDGDGALSPAEVRSCFENTELTGDQENAFDAAFNRADLDVNGKLTLAELQSFIENERQRTASAAAGNATQGTITVTQPAPEITVSQSAAKVTVKQAAPQVAIDDKTPRVSVSQPEPEVAVTQPEPKVSVEQPTPDVTVTQPEPDVTVEQPEPEVTVAANEPTVSVEQAAPEVEVDESAETVTAETNTEASPANETRSGYTIRIDDWMDATVLNADGEEIGTVTDVVLDPADDMPMVVLAVGGFFGIGEKKIAFPYEDFAIANGAIVLDSTMTRQDVEGMEPYDAAAYEELPERMVVR
ncbi:PRC-barrel domain-containing protein [Acuticoccus sp. M5D2P5]|uniref:PRC-barrel domain-containing protein n=1 Tax=Acuticoccus kalidii TaxID=2910977 RepID=UPI001F1B0EB5|nr:PRC-barrel domain-containing protein [Acuticoccus kalidii]MCF3932190.1 PRC-barrel domain-containing protein [Acuticoccus kalidii]